MTEKTCEDCKFRIMNDYGYSNYTVEGTTVDCLLNMNPNFPKDRWYGKDKSLEFAKECGSFKQGNGVHTDVDQENGAIENYTDDEEVKALLNAMYRL